jgi:predicted nucleic acid-binding protein
VPSTAAWVDTGFLVALFSRSDSHHKSALAFLERSGHLELHSIWPVVSEANFFLNPQAREALLEWLAQGPIVFHELSLADLKSVQTTMKKYRNLKPDFADAVLVTFASELGIDKIITVDVRNFSAYRIRNGKSFERLWL